MKHTHRSQALYALFIIPAVTISAGQSQLDEHRLLELQEFNNYISQAPNLPEPSKPESYSFASLLRSASKLVDPVPFCTEANTENIALNLLSIAHAQNLTDPSCLRPAIERAKRFHRKTEYAFPLIISKLPKGPSSRSLNRVLGIHRATLPPLLECLVKKHINDMSIARLQKLTPLLGASEQSQQHILQSITLTTPGQQIKATPVEQSTSSWLGSVIKDWTDAIGSSKSNQLLGHYQWFRESIDKSNLSDPIILAYLLAQAPFFEKKFNTATHALLSLISQPNARLEDIFEIATINELVLSPLIYLLAMKIFCDRAENELTCGHPSTTIPAPLIQKLSSFSKEIKEKILSLEKLIFSVMKKANRIESCRAHTVEPLLDSPREQSFTQSTHSEPIPIPQGGTRLRHPRAASLDEEIW